MVEPSKRQTHRTSLVVGPRKTSSPNIKPAARDGQSSSLDRKSGARRDRSNGEAGYAREVSKLAEVLRPAQNDTSEQGGPKKREGDDDTESTKDEEAIATKSEGDAKVESSRVGEDGDAEKEKWQLVL